MDFTLKGIVRSGAQRALEVIGEFSEDHDLYTVNGRGAPYSEIVRGGEVWNAISAAGTPLVVIPTTLCIAEYYNNTPDRVMEILDLYLFHLLGTAALHNLSLWAEVTPKKAAPSVASSITIGSQSGKAPYVAVAGSDVVPAAATTVVAGGWRPFGMPGPGVVSTALPGEAWGVPVDGKLLVPPGCSLAITAVDALATASSVQVGASWNLRRIRMD